MKSVQADLKVVDFTNHEHNPMNLHICVGLFLPIMMTIQLKKSTIHTDMYNV